MKSLNYGTHDFAIKDSVRGVVVLVLFESNYCIGLIILTIMMIFAALSCLFFLKLFSLLFWLMML